MKTTCLAIALLATPPLAHAADICRSVSTLWEADGHTYRTQISRQARNGCKIIWQSVDGAETEGTDCNCDLLVDGHEHEFPRPPSAYQAERLLETCRGPASNPADARTRPDTKTPRILKMQGASR